MPVGMLPEPVERIPQQFGGPPIPAVIIRLRNASSPRLGKYVAIALEFREIREKIVSGFIPEPFEMPREVLPDVHECISADGSIDTPWEFEEMWAFLRAASISA